ncbi:tRNA (5-methylaminomethyl-2-thiouridine)(34)-methyltransferase MnmD [Roseivirga thermotolerans]|uniref:tRNA (5-methylaminomethyl-2-thiouridine)(34)-methyltransferase MnmD n=1 Tax=Roseivirga thermotolerans TaxID=1758176 RepID=UPI00273D3B70|nr:tRNA (5-methylaminomethyl-2-thiouridine)(34)-methyltransferase MnmD [Roseivirga thermotolerans]
MSGSVKLIVTSDGSHSLYNPELKETYHSTHGALSESLHVFIKEGIQHMLATGFKVFHILEIGFGTGLNVMLVWDYALKHAQNDFHVTSLEPYPLSEEIYSGLNYAEVLNGSLTQADLLRLHQVEWSEKQVLAPNFSLLKQPCKLEDFTTDEKFNLVFYDAFAPSKQAELWGIEPLESIYNKMANGGFLVTYCAQGQFKRNLAGLGMEVETLKGPPGKKEMVRARKI